MKWFTVSAFVVGALVASTRLSAAEPPLISVPGGQAVFGEDVVAEAQRAPAERRASALADTASVARMAQNVLTRRVLAAEAERDQLDKDPGVQALLRLARERVLSEARVAQIDGEPPERAALEKLALSEYRADPGKFDLTEQIRVRHILIDSRSCEAEKRIADLLARARGGEDFGELAKANSQDPGSAPQGGDLGFFSRGKTVPEFEAAAFALKTPGELSDIIRTEFGYHIIRFEERKPGQRQPFEKVRDAIVQDLSTRDARRRRAAAIEEIERGMKVDPAAIEAFAKRSR